MRTDRLRLRSWREDDKPALWRMNAKPEVTLFLLPVRDRADSDARAESIMEHFTQHGFGLWVVETPGIAPFTGFTGLRHIPTRPHSRRLSRSPGVSTPPSGDRDLQQKLRRHASPSAFPALA